MTRQELRGSKDGEHWTIIYRSAPDEFDRSTLDGWPYLQQVTYEGNRVLRTRLLWTPEGDTGVYRDTWVCIDCSHNFDAEPSHHMHRLACPECGRDDTVSMR